MTLEKEDIGPVCLLIGSVVLCFSKLLLSGDSLYGSDFLCYFYPAKQFILDTFRADYSIPLWNPYLFSGTPFIGNIQASMFYPLGFLYYLLPTQTAYLYSTVLHCSLGIVFMYVLSRLLSISRPGAFLSAFVFIFNGYFMAHLYAGHLSFVQNYIWMPVVFLFVWRFVSAGLYRYALLSGLVLGVQILGGFPQIAFYTILTIICVTCFNMYLNVIEGEWKGACRIFGGSVLIIALGFAVAGIQVLPTYEFTQLSTRAGGIGYDFATKDSFPPGNLITFVFPLLFGSPMEGTYWLSERSWEFWEYCGYIGIVPLVLVFWFISKLLARRTGLFFVILASIALFLAFGKYNPLYRFIYHLPGFNDFRIPAQILFLYVFSMSILAGRGFDAAMQVDLSSRLNNKIVALLISLFLLVLVYMSVVPSGFMDAISWVASSPGMIAGSEENIYTVARHAILRSAGFFMAFLVVLYFRDKKRLSMTAMGISLIVLTIVDTGSFSYPMVQAADINGIMKAKESLQVLVNNAGKARAVIIKGRCFIENAGLWYRFDDIQGYDPLILRRYMEYINRSQGLPPDEKIVNMHYIRHVDNPLIRMLNLGYVVDCMKGRIFGIRNAVPREYIVHEVVEKNSADILDFMMGPKFIPGQMVVLEHDRWEREIPSESVGEVSNDNVYITASENHEIQLMVHMGTSGFLVSSELNYPGWRVFIDGREGRVLTGNYIFRTIFLEEGVHKVRFLFDPLSFKLGALLSASTIMFTILLLLVAFKRTGRRLSHGKENSR